MYQHKSVFTEKLYHEAILLLNEAKEYMQFQAPHDISSLSFQDSFFLSCEVTRVTARLTEIISWILVQKAIESGKISPMNVSGFIKKLKGDETLTVDSQETCPVPIPPKLEDLLEKSRNLYLRLLWLERELGDDEEDK